MKVNATKNLDISISIFADACNRIISEIALEDSAKAVVDEPTISLPSEHVSAGK